MIVRSSSDLLPAFGPPFQCEFAALYLPQFIARYLWLMEVDGTAGSSLTLLHTLATAPSFFGRWVRLNLEEAVRLFIVLARDAIQKWPTMPIVKGVSFRLSDGYVARKDRGGELTTRFLSVRSAFPPFLDFTVRSQRRSHLQLHRSNHQNHERHRLGISSSLRHSSLAAASLLPLSSSRRDSQARSPEDQLLPTRR